MKDGTMNSIGQKPQGFWQIVDSQFHLRLLSKSRGITLLALLVKETPYFYAITHFSL
jgi:hypothetical protein